MSGKKKSRFVVVEDDARLIEKRGPTDEEIHEADAVFDRILKRRKEN